MLVPADELVLKTSSLLIVGLSEPLSYPIKPTLGRVFRNQTDCLGSNPGSAADGFQTLDNVLYPPDFSSIVCKME